jgi:hypothetical protein
VSRLPGIDDAVLAGSLDGAARTVSCGWAEGAAGESNAFPHLAATLAAPWPAVSLRVRLPFVSEEVP